MTIPKLIIIGAGRSGTNILRDTLTQIGGWETWDCDEINLIWRYGNIDMPHDFFGPEQARPEVADYVLSAFAKMAAAQKADVVVEKTCANSLRIPFIETIMPDARYLYIIRDGRDVALSAAKRWTASVEPAYLAKKLRYAPVNEIPHYAIRFIKNRWRQMHAADKRQALWGPVLPDMQDWARGRPLLDICAHQWAGCVEASDAAFEAIEDERKFAIHYEDLVARPEEILAEFLGWYGQPDAMGQIEQALSAIHLQQPDDWKKHRESFSQQALDRMADSLKRHGYDPTT